MFDKLLNRVLSCRQILLQFYSLQLRASIFITANRVQLLLLAKTFLSCSCLKNRKQVDSWRHVYAY